MAEESIDELFAQALSGEYDDETAWEAVLALRHIGTRQVFHRAADLCKSSDPLSRARGADVLAQLGRTEDHKTNCFPEESDLLVRDLVQREMHICPLAAGIAALGHIENPLAIPLVASFSLHTSPEIRFSVTLALGCFPNDSLAVASLLQLAQDLDDDVRDWAIFGLGVLSDVDSPAIRETLIQCLKDPNEDVREEAMAGLGKRKDTYLLPMLLTALEQNEI